MSQQRINQERNARDAEQEAQELRELEEAYAARVGVQELSKEERRQHPGGDARTAAELLEEERGGRG